VWVQSLVLAIALIAGLSPLPAEAEASAPRESVTALSQLVALQVVPGAKAATTDALPSEIPLFPLPEVVLFPGVPRPLLIYEPRYRDMVADALKGNRVIGMVLLRPGYEKDYEGRPPIYDIGCAGVIEDYEQLPDGRYAVAAPSGSKIQKAQKPAFYLYAPLPGASVPGAYCGHGQDFTFTSNQDHTCFD